MAAIDNIIQVQVTSGSIAVATESFATPLILGPTNLAAQDGPQSPPGPGNESGAVHQTMITCSSPADVLSAGYSTDNPEYVYAVALCSQAIRPAVFKVCQRTGSNTVAADLESAQLLDDTWYSVVCPGLTDAEIEQAAAQIESMNKLFVAVTSTAAVADGSNTTDVGSVLKSGSHTRTALLWSPGSATAGIEAAWVGGQVAKPPGSATWAYKTLAGIPADAINPGQAAALFGIPVNGSTGKSVNAYQVVGGVAVTQEGTTSDGGFIDFRIGLDSLMSVIKTNIYQVLVSAEKLPFTDAGAICLEGAVKAAIDQHVAFGFIDGGSPITVSHTPVAQISSTQRAQRKGPPIQFSCRASGAQHAVSISGTVNV